MYFAGCGSDNVVNGLGFGAGYASTYENAAARLTPEIIESAKKWAAARGLPPEWVLATILVESQGNPNAVGDYHILPNGASIGLMQVNTVAHAGPLRKAKVTREMLKNPDTNIEWGTLILRSKYNLIDKAMKTARKPLRGVPLDILTRLLYTGVDTVRHIYRGTDPRPGSKPSVMAWEAALQTASPLVG